MKGLLEERAEYVVKEKERISQDVRELVNNNEYTINRKLCAQSYRKHFVSTGEFPRGPRGAHHLALRFCGRYQLSTKSSDAWHRISNFTSTNVTETLEHRDSCD
jgi:hypothetical protein